MKTALLPRTPCPLCGKLIVLAKNRQTGAPIPLDVTTLVVRTPEGQGELEIEAVISHLPACVKANEFSHDCGASLMSEESLNANKVLVALLALIVKQGGQVSISFHEYVDAGQHYSLRWEPTEQHDAAILTAVRAEAPMEPGFRKVRL